MNRDNKNDKALDIVDGQQRLTTFLLFLNILQMNIEEEDFVDCRKVIKSDELINALNKISDDMSRYSINIKLLSEKTETFGLDINQGTEFYINLIKFMLDNVYFVKLTTEEMELSDVVSVFNTINTTGLDLNASDIFKFKYYDYLRKNDNTKPWMERINECYKLIEDGNNELHGLEGRTEPIMLSMSAALDIYKHIICAEFGWGFSEVSKSNLKFFDELFKEKKYMVQDYPSVLRFDSFKKIVKGYINYCIWLEESRYSDEYQDITKELFSNYLVEKSRYSRYWTIPFMVAYFKAGENDWSDYYIDALKVNLYMFKFFAIYSVINDKVINAVQNKVCVESFNWFKSNSIDGIISSINELMWSSIRWDGDNPKEEFYRIIRAGLFYNGSRVHLICTLIALLDEINNLGKTINLISGKVKISNRSIQERLFNWRINPYDIEHILARNNFKDDKDNVDEFNGIGNLVILDRNINRNIKDNPVNEKVQEYEKSKYASVRKELLGKYKKCNDWGIETVRKRQEEEILKIENFMNEK